MHPRRLEQFLTICKFGSMSAAAKELGIAQPALSKQILQLEHDLKVVLFKRHSRGVTLTRAGERLKSEAADLVRRMDDLRSAIRSDEGDVTGRVIVAVISSLAPVLASELYPRMEREYPGISFSIVDYSSEMAGQALLQKSADLALLPNAAIDLPQAQSVPLLEESFFLISQAVSRHRSGVIDFAEAAQRPLILPFRNHDLRRRLDDVARSAGVDLNIKYETGSINVIGSMVEQGMVASIVPITHWLNRIDEGKISSRLIQQPQISRVHSLCWLDHRDPSDAFLAVQDVLISEVRSLISIGKLSGELVQV